MQGKLPMYAFDGAVDRCAVEIVDEIIFFWVHPSRLEKVQGHVQIRKIFFKFYFFIK